MSSDFSRCLSLLRQEKGISQRAAAKDLGISQALLSHYENGVREPGLAFVTKACNYYNVSADFLLGRTLSRDGTTIAAEELYDYSTEKDNVLHGSIMATLNKKLLVNSNGVLIDLLGKTGRKEAINAAGNFPPMHNDALMENYPGLYQSLLQIIHNTGERVNRRMEIQNQK